MKDHQIRELVDTLRGIAIEFHDSQQLRQLLSVAVCEAFAGFNESLALLKESSVEVMIVHHQAIEEMKRIIVCDGDIALTGSSLSEAIAIHASNYQYPAEVCIAGGVKTDTSFRGGSRKKGGKTKYRRNK